MRSVSELARVIIIAKILTCSLVSEFAFSYESECLNYPEPLIERATEIEKLIQNTSPKESIEIHAAYVGKKSSKGLYHYPNFPKNAVMQKDKTVVFAGAFFGTGTETRAGFVVKDGKLTQTTWNFWKRGATLTLFDKINKKEYSVIVDLTSCDFSEKNTHTREALLACLKKSIGEQAIQQLEYQGVINPKTHLSRISFNSNSKPNSIAIMDLAHGFPVIVRNGLAVNNHKLSDQQGMFASEEKSLGARDALLSHEQRQVFGVTKSGKSFIVSLAASVEGLINNLSEVEKVLGEKIQSVFLSDAGSGRFFVDQSRKVVSEWDSPASLYPSSIILENPIIKK